MLLKRRTINTHLLMLKWNVMPQNECYGIEQRVAERTAFHQSQLIKTKPTGAVAGSGLNQSRVYTFRGIAERIGCEADLSSEKLLECFQQVSFSILKILNIHIMLSCFHVLTCITSFWYQSINCYAFIACYTRLQKYFIGINQK